MLLIENLIFAEYREYIKNVIYFSAPDRKSNFGRKSRIRRTDPQGGTFRLLLILPSFIKLSSELNLIYLLLENQIFTENRIIH